MIPGMPYTGYIFILAIITTITYLSLTKEKSKAYPWILYISGLGMILTTTMAGPYLVGCDIKLEYYYAQLHSGMDVLPPLLGTPQGASLGNWLIAPLIGKVIPLLWVYKLIFPMLYALVPVVMYYVFRRWVDSKKAFLGGIVLVIFPAFHMEIPAVVRHMTAELVLVGVLWLLVKSNMRRRWKVPLLVGCGGLMALMYYTVTIVALSMLGVILLAGLIRRQKRLALVGVMVGALVVGGIYYSKVEEGAVVLKLGHLYNGFAPEVLELDIPRMKIPMPSVITPNVEVKDKEPGELTIGASEELVEIAPPDTKESLEKVRYVDRIGRLTRSALGFDFLEQDIWGRLFRVWQWGFFALIPIGLWRLRKDKEYLMFGTGGIFLGSLLLIPGFFGLLSVTRVVHLSLLTLAPAVASSLKPRYLLIILVPYFLFTSGFVFEVTQQPDIEGVTIPYNYALTNQRIDLGIGASLTEDDYKVRQYIYDNRLFPVYSGIQGSDFMGEIIGWRSSWNRTFQTFHKQMDIPGGEAKGYIFVNSRSAEDGLFTLWNGGGCRRRVTPESLGIDIDKNVVYQVGESRVLGVK